MWSPQGSRFCPTDYVSFDYCVVAGRFGLMVTALMTSKIVKLRRARLVLGLVTIFVWSSIPVFIRPLRPIQPGHPPVGRWNEYWWWFLPPLGKKRLVMRSSGPCYQDYWYTGLLYASLIGSNPRRFKGQREWAPSRRTSRSMRVNLL